jgi:putative ABC transport system substrate-binding protein
MTRPKLGEASAWPPLSFLDQQRLRFDRQRRLAVQEGINQMKKRNFITLLGWTTAAAPFPVWAQKKQTPLVGVLVPSAPWPGFSPVPDARNPDAFHEGLKDAGFLDSENIAFEYRFANGRYDRLPVLAAELVSLKVDVIITNSTPGAFAAKGATSTIPIVFTSVGDPIGSGLVASLAHPGGNLTGFSNFNAALAPKVLDLIAALIPRASSIALLANPKNPYSEMVIRSVGDASRGKGVDLTVLNAGTEAEIDAAFATLVQGPTNALIVEGDPFFSSRRDQIVGLAARQSVPAIYLHLIYAVSGGLLIYGIDEAATSRQAGYYAGRILKGARPGDLPVQQPTTFKLIVNLNTARSLGLTISQSILARADEVIE